MRNGMKITGISESSISSNCTGKSKSAGIHPITGEKLHWMYLEDYLKLHNESTEIESTINT